MAKRIPQDYAEAYLECRDRSRAHLWVEDEQTARPSRRAGCFVVVMACARCGGVKWMYYNSKYEKVGATVYRMRPTYAAGSFSQQAVRRALYRSKDERAKVKPDKREPKGLRPRFPEDEGEVIDLSEVFRSVKIN